VDAPGVDAYRRTVDGAAVDVGLTCNTIVDLATSRFVIVDPF
jgi:hypothetical protein